MEIMTTDEKPKISNPAIFIIVLIFFLISSGLIIYGLFNKKEKIAETADTKEITIKETEENPNLQDYFNLDTGTDPILQNDI